MLDETTDVMNKLQLSVVLRYVYRGSVYERFLKFVYVSADKTAAGLFREVEKIVEEFKIGEKLVGQTYDGFEWLAK